ncbi:LOW QUALITY PROTEIN: 5'-3' exonuclease PLD3-like [Pituophis catenifer annectens]|uniref:LOW QUALITY PROTEIN: 5'-3' exonuclease PLD3-like n=1 Tax=Pituophis catenifer annectens TaxID=94852 RepID=UPI0039940745
MRKKLPAQNQASVTPIRRSTRLQQEKTAEKKEPQHPRSRADDILQPRESIKAYKKQVVDPTEERPDPPGTPSESGAQLDVGRRAEKVVPPFVRLRRLELKEDPSPHPERGKELDTPNIQWAVVKDRESWLQILDTSKPQSGKVGHLEDTTTPSLRRPIETRRESRQETWTEITPRIKVPPMKKMESTKLPPKASAAKEVHQKLFKFSKFSWSSLCFLLFFLLLILTCWLVWNHGVPATLVLGNGSLMWKKLTTLWNEGEECSSQCSLVLLESIPDSLQYPPSSPQNPTTYEGWMDLLSEANSVVEIGAFYFTLRDSDLQMEDASAMQGLEVFNMLRSLPSRGVKLEIAVNSPQSSEDDTDELARDGADVQYVKMKELTGGIVHTKLWIVDRKHLYIGSANMDWRSLTQVKELGIALYNCSCLAKDLHRIFAMYQILGKEGASLPTTWPRDLAAESSLEEPRKIQLNGVEAQVYISSSPPALCSTGRTSDLTAILSTIEDAQEFIYISVMDYEPQCIYCKSRRLWPVIDDALRSAACDKGVTVRLLISCWQHSRQTMFVFLESLTVLRRKPLHCPIEVKLFAVPIEGREIPYAHVNHNKYMVTDRVAYVGTSNWSEDYFLRTAGVGLIVNQSGVAPEAQSYTLRQQLVDVFLRDWESPYTLPLENHSECMKKLRE